ncbi:MAG: aminodeoxychorismate synthase component I, partial [Deltaproteobacteria bacterium]
MKTNRAIFINPGNPESIWNAELTGAVATVTATEIDRVLPCLREAEKLRESGYFVAGYIAYEAAPSLDPKMTTHPPSSLPLCHFTAFEKMRKPSPPFSKESGFAISKLQEEISDDDYLARVLLVKDLISRGDVYQVNLTYRLRGRFEGSSLTLFSEILEKVDFPYCAFLDSQEWSILSFSPELFFHVKGNRIKTSPMKGTAPRGATEEEDVKREKELSESLKNASENLMIVDLLRNDLGKICLPGSVRVPSLFRVEKYRTLFQMVTDIVGELSGRGSLEEILRALFPCGSITGTPKIRSMEIIREVEKSPRGVYTGAIGLLMPTGESIFSVAIRTATVLKKARLVEFGTGGGIVFDSSPAEELEETKLKSLFFRSHDSSFSLLETVLYEKGKGFFLLEEHEKRMEEGATYFSFPFQKSEFRKSLEKAVTGLRWEKAVVRILLDREGRFSWTVTPIKEEEIRPWTVRVIPADFDPSSPFVLHKTTV